MKLTNDLNGSTILHIIGWIVTLTITAFSVGTWKASTEANIQSLKQEYEQAKVFSDADRDTVRRNLEKMALRSERINTRLSRIEGRLNIRNAEGD